MSPVLLDVAHYLDAGGASVVELIYEDRRILLAFDRDESQSHWAIATRGGHDRDGGGWLRDTTTAEVIKRGTSP